MARMQAATPTTARNVHNYHCCVSRWSETRQTVLVVVVLCDRETNSAMETAGFYGEIDKQVPTLHQSCVTDGGTTCIGETEFTLVYWKRETPSYEIEDNVRLDLAHDGWIHGLTAIDNTIYSCGCDRSVKSWMLTNTGFVHQRTYEMPNEQMCVLSSCPQRAIIGGAFSGTIYVFDSRSSNNPISQYRPHTTRVTNK
ncbi:uncharacterized protein [Temnothorax longispinosus]|uniref:uncharacterized protein isoform X2 n=1 Tax=Temnothorax longispinosus TaxID=300112 RepID=UPI003A99C331